MAKSKEFIEIRGAAEHNLKRVDAKIPKHQFVVFTGPSGSGKSSLAFDTIYAEGQRRYVESLSAYARQFLGQMEKPKYDHIRGLSPTISIEQKSASNNPRSTVGTITEIYDYLRVLYARIGKQHCHQCGDPVEQLSAAEISARLRKLPKKTRFLVMARLVDNRKGEYRDLLQEAEALNDVAGNVGCAIETTSCRSTTKRRSTPSTLWLIAWRCPRRTCAALRLA